MNTFFPIRVEINRFYMQNIQERNVIGKVYGLLKGRLISSNIKNNQEK